MKTLSEEFLQWLSELEGKRSEMYYCSAGCPTIGVGHKLTQSEMTSGKIVIWGEKVRWSQGLSDEDIKILLAQDLRWAIDTVSLRVRVPLTQNQYEALISFVFNIGMEAFANSTLLRLLNEGHYEAVPDQMRRWNKVTKRGQKVVVAGLANRREAEVTRWLT